MHPGCRSQGSAAKPIADGCQHARCSWPRPAPRERRRRRVTLPRRSGSPVRFETDDDGPGRLCSMRVTVTGATGLVGPKLIQALHRRGDEVTVLTRNPTKARAALAGVEAVEWADPAKEPAPAGALSGRDAV